MTHPSHSASRATAFLIALCLMAQLPLPAQNPAFAEAPDDLLHSVVAMHPEMPAQTSLDIAIIETNAPEYLASSDKSYRYRRLDALITLEVQQLKPSPYVRSFWYEFIEAKAPELTESEIDAIAHQWWSDNGNQAVKRDERGGSKGASFEEVRTRFRAFRTGNETQVRAAENWLLMAQVGDHWERFSLPPQVQGMSPLAHLLALEIAKEAAVYSGEEAEKLRRTVRSLLADKFMAEGDAGIAHIVSSSDVNAVLDDLTSKDEARKYSAQELLEEWIKRAIDEDLKKDSLRAPEPIAIAGRTNRNRQPRPRNSNPVAERQQI